MGRKFTPEQKILVQQYMEELCKDLTMEQNGMIFVLSLNLATSGMDLSDPNTLKALEVVTNYVSFLQGIAK